MLLNVIKRILPFAATATLAIFVMSLLGLLVFPKYEGRRHKHRGFKKYERLLNENNRLRKENYELRREKNELDTKLKEAEMLELDYRLPYRPKRSSVAPLDK